MLTTQTTLTRKCNNQRNIRRKNYITKEHSFKRKISTSSTTVMVRWDIYLQTVPAKQKQKISNDQETT